MTDTRKLAMKAVHDAIRDERTGNAVKMTIKHEPFYEAVERAIMEARLEGQNAERERILSEITSIFEVSQGSIAMRDYIVRMIRGETERGSKP